MILPLAGLLCLPGCNDEEEKRSAQRIRVLESRLADRTETLGAVRVVAFAVLAGGAVAGLCYLGSSLMDSGGRPSRPPAQPARPALPVWTGRQPVRDARIIELDPAAPAVPAPPALAQEPRRRRQPRRQRSRRVDPRNHEPDSKPRP
jgi:hypothetical protein